MQLVSLCTHEIVKREVFEYPENPIVEEESEVLILAVSLDVIGRSFL